MYSSTSSFDKENTTDIVLKNVNFLVRLGIKNIDNEMGDEVLSPPPFLSSVAQRSLTCASSHITVMCLRVISKKL